MSNKLTEEELIKIGVNLENITEGGEMNIIVQCFGSKDGMVEDYETGEILPVNKMYPDIYQPRKNRVYSCSGVKVEASGLSYILSASRLILIVS